MLLSERSKKISQEEGWMKFTKVGVGDDPFLWVRGLQGLPLSILLFGCQDHWALGLESAS